MIEGIEAKYLLADRGYDSDEIVKKSEEMGFEVVIPPKKNRRKQRDYDEYLYKIRHVIENTFLHLKRWRGIATRYAKTLKAFEAAVQIACIAKWLKVLA